MGAAAAKDKCQTDKRLFKANGPYKYRQIFPNFQIQANISEL